MTDKQLEALANIDVNRPKSAVVKKALEKFQKDQEEREVELTQQRLARANRETMAVVENLQNLRKVERGIKAHLRAVGDAEKAYQDTGDWDAYSKAMQNAPRCPRWRSLPPAMVSGMEMMEIRYKG